MLNSRCKAGSHSGEQYEGLVPDGADVTSDSMAACPQLLAEMELKYNLMQLE